MNKTTTISGSFIFTLLIGAVFYWKGNEAAACVSICWAATQWRVDNPRTLVGEK